MMRMNRKGFTLVEIMIVVAIIGLLAAIAIPNFMGARTSARKQACIATLKQIEGAKEIWALDYNQSDTSTPASTDLFGATKYVKTVPVCPGSGTYTINPVSTAPTCSLGTEQGHKLPT